MTKKAKKQPKVVYPIVEIGTHLAVITYEDGSTELIWDDEKLEEEVRQATSKTKNTKAKRNQPS